VWDSTQRTAAVLGQRHVACRCDGEGTESDTPVQTGETELGGTDTDGLEEEPVVEGKKSTNSLDKKTSRKRKGTTTEKKLGGGVITKVGCRKPVRTNSECSQVYSLGTRTKLKVRGKNLRVLVVGR
jgi:hypothetical protein